MQIQFRKAPEKQMTLHETLSGACVRSHLFLFMHDTTNYTQKIKNISLQNGVVLSDEEAYEILARLIPLVRVIYQPKEKHKHGRYRQRSAGSTHADRRGD